MKVRPILFSGEMVRAIMEGRKTQTRRVLRGIDGRGADATVARYGGGIRRLCPYGQPYDQLWVREGHYFTHVKGHERSGKVVYRAEHPYEPYPPSGLGRPWRPSIHMPRWASRITLEITGIRVERLQSITDDDCVAEGIKQEWTCLNPGTGSYARDNDVRDDFRALWDSVSREKAPWSGNPWVWVIEFRVIRGLYMSRWTHPMCAECWERKNPDRSPVRVGSADPESCCWCGSTTTDGIYLREDPKTLPCGGKHSEAQVG